MKLLGKIEQQVNRIIGLDEDALLRLADLSDQVILLELINTGFMIYILPCADGLHLHTEYEGNTNVRIRGTPSDMLAYLIKSNKVPGSFADSIEVIGDVGLAQDFQSILLNIDLDWEEQLARWFGDTLAHQMGRVLRGSVSLARNSGDKLQQDVSEYLRFERELTLDITALTKFGSDVDILRDDVERLGMRINRLEKNKKVNVK